MTLIFPVAHRDITKILRISQKNARMSGVKGLVNFINQSINELRKIEWPKKDETVKLTGYVIGISLGVGLLIMVFDYMFKELLTLILTN